MPFNSRSRKIILDTRSVASFFEFLLLGMHWILDIASRVEWNHSYVHVGNATNLGVLTDLVQMSLPLPISKDLYRYASILWEFQICFVLYASWWYGCFTVEYSIYSPHSHKWLISFRYSIATIPWLMIISTHVVFC